MMRADLKREHRLLDLYMQHGLVCRSSMKSGPLRSGSAQGNSPETSYVDCVIWDMCCASPQTHQGMQASRWSRQRKQHEYRRN